MGANALRDLLNRLRWDPGAASPGVVLRVVRRGSDRPGTAEVGFAEIASVGTRGVTLVDGTFLPYHRVVAVFSGERALWRARREEV